MDLELADHRASALKTLLGTQLLLSRLNSLLDKTRRARAGG